MVIEYKNYQVRRSSNSLCWEIYELRKVSSKEKGTRDDWVSMGIYPSTLGHALSIIYERELKKGDDVCDLKSAVTTAKRLHKELMEIGGGK